MKNILFYSPDFNMCISLLIYLEYGYKVTTTTDLEVLDSLVNNSKFDLIILDVEPLPEVEEIVLNIKNKVPLTPVVLTYVYKNQLKEYDRSIRKYVSSVFYKPVDLHEISSKIPAIMTEHVGTFSDERRGESL